MNFVLIIFVFVLRQLELNSFPVDKNSSRLNAAQKAMLSEYKMSELPAALRISQIIPKFVRPKNFNLTQIEKDLKHFGIHSLKDDQHLEGLPLERDGKINVDFHKEIFLGNHEDFQNEIEHDKDKRNDKLTEIFRR